MVVTRYAPSPTGYLHLGGLRTALFNYLFAKQHGGRFLLRIEDTDTKRTVPGAAEHLQLLLSRFGLHHDGTVERQSDRLPLYHEHAENLLENGRAYRCFCTEERLKEMKLQSRFASGHSSGYDGKCRSLSLEDVRFKLENNEPHVLRMKTPTTGTTVIEDIVHGRTVFENSTIDDQIIIKSDGFPTYHLASVVDDHHMNVSHVIRGDEWMSSTPKHMALYDSLGWNPPEFAHLPLLLNKNHSKLSKRNGDGDVNSLLDEEGYLPSGVLNFVALLGWSPKLPSDDEETLTDVVFPSMESLIEKFDIRRATKKGVVVDPDFMYWMNGQHVRLQEPQALVDELRLSCPAAAEHDTEHLLKVIDLIKTRVFRMRDLSHYAAPFIACEKFPLERSGGDKLVLDSSYKDWKEIIPIIVQGLTSLSDWSSQSELKGVLKNITHEVKDQKHPTLKFKNLMLIIRWATTGTLQGAELQPTFQLLGKHETISRLETCI